MKGTEHFKQTIKAFWIIRQRVMNSLPKAITSLTKYR